MYVNVYGVLVFNWNEKINIIMKYFLCLFTDLNV